MNSPKRGFRPIGQKPPEQIAPGTKREPPNYRFINGERVRLRNFKRFGAA